MLQWLKRWWPVLKVAFFVVVVGAVGWQFWTILQNEELQRTDQSLSPAEILWEQTLAAQPIELVLSGLLYLIGLAFSAWFWMLLLRVVGERMPVLPGVRGYYISHLGKYVPGKGWALVMRTTYAAEAGVRPGLAVLTAVYETLTTMAAGALLATILVLAQAEGETMRLWQVLLLLALAGIPIVPGVFNWVLQGLSRRVLKDRTAPLPLLKNRTLFAGLALTACGWIFLGASLQAVLIAMNLEPAGWTLAVWVRCTTFVAVSYVAGFIASTPGGLGVREFLLQQFLAPTIGAQAVVVVLLLRLLWTVAEVVMAGIVFWLPKKVISDQ